MITARLDALNMKDLATPADRSIGSRSHFPLYAATGASNTSVVYFEVEPGKRLGLHADSVEEVILILEGHAEAVIDGERGRLGPGGLAVVPALAPHDVYNVGEETLRVVGFFAGGSVVHVFSEPFLPGADVAVFIHSATGESALAATHFVAPVPA